MRREGWTLGSGDGELGWLKKVGPSGMELSLWVILSSWLKC